MAVGRRSLTPHCLGGVHSLLALRSTNIWSGSGETVEVSPKKLRLFLCVYQTQRRCTGRELREKDVNTAKKHVCSEEALAGKLWSNLFYAVLKCSVRSRACAFVRPRHPNASLIGIFTQTLRASQKFWWGCAAFISPVTSHWLL